MTHRPLPLRAYQHAEDDDFWASGLMLLAGAAACAAYIVVCLVSLAYPDAGDDLRATVTVGPVQTVAVGTAVGHIDTATLLAPREVAMAGASAGCQKSVRSSHR
ncbi:MAG: hypothetical protein E6R07_07000 [Nevskiaceae bacterium]|nr:MAG: hypothetical protein E6R07_07000 [Nevskiaceae bacterium]